MEGAGEEGEGGETMRWVKVSFCVLIAAIMMAWLFFGIGRVLYNYTENAFNITAVFTIIMWLIIGMLIVAQMWENEKKED